MTKLSRFILPPAAFAIITLVLLSGTLLGDHLVFELVDLMFFHAVTKELALASISPSRWLFFGIKFFILAGVFSILWGLLTSLAWRTKTIRLIGLKNTDQTTRTYFDVPDAEDREAKKNGMSFIETMEELNRVKLSELGVILIAGVLLTFILLSIGVSAIMLFLMLTSFVFGLFIEQPSIAPSTLLFIGAFVIGTVCMVIGYVYFNRNSEY